MAHKKKHEGPVPPGNRPHRGPGEQSTVAGEKEKQAGGERGSSQEQDPKRRLGDFTGTGEHSMQEPGGKNDANH